MKMKATVIICMLAALSAGMKAQVQVSVGPGLGFSYAMHETASGDTNLPAHLGLLATSQIDLQFSRTLSLLVWLDFYNDMSAGEDADNIDEFAYNYMFKVNYLHLSPTLKFCIPGSPFYLFGGPGVGLKTKGKVKAGVEGISVEEDLEDMKTRFDFRLGAGYDFFLNNRLTLSPFVTYNAGLIEVVADSDWKVSALQAGVVLRFNISK
jgi:opacity protein-like surface antigen